MFIILAAFCEMNVIILKQFYPVLLKKYRAAEANSEK